MGDCRVRQIRSGIFAASILLLVTVVLGVAQTKPLAVMQGKLVTTRSGCAMVETNGQEHPLSANTAHLLHTLEDKRLEGRDVRLEGIAQADGTFEVHWLFTIHNGKLFRVRYFCATCNIVALEPGICVCCQQPTELQEVPADR